MSQIELLSFNIWQLWIPHVSIATVCYYNNAADVELPSNNIAEYSFLNVSVILRRFKKNQTHQNFLFVKGCIFFCR